MRQSVLQFTQPSMHNQQYTGKTALQKTKQKKPQKQKKKRKKNHRDTLICSVY